MRRKFLSSLLAVLMLLSVMGVFVGCDMLLDEDFYDMEYEEIGLGDETEASETSKEESTAVESSDTAASSELTEVIESADESEAETSAASSSDTATDASTESTEAMLDPDGSYTTKEDVSLYIYQYGCLPSNFMTKDEARDLGWSGGSLEPYAPGMCIGGDYFGNYEGLLPSAPGREYTECDINTLGASSRGAERIIFSNDGLIYYTNDHYESFTLLYGEE